MIYILFGTNCTGEFFLWVVWWVVLPKLRMDNIRTTSRCAISTQTDSYFNYFLVFVIKHKCVSWPVHLVIMVGHLVISSLNQSDASCRNVYDHMLKISLAIVMMVWQNVNIWVCLHCKKKWVVLTHFWLPQFHAFPHHWRIPLAKHSPVSLINVLESLITVGM